MTSSLLSDLNEVQKKAVTHTEGPALILAGAGSGKTRVLTYRAAYLIKDEHVEGDAILLMTFTNKAAGEMKNRILTLLGGTAVTPVAGTFHSFCAKVLRKNGRHIGIPVNFVIYDEQDQLDTMKDVMAKLNVTGKSYHPRAILHTVSEIKNELVTPEEYSGIARGMYQEIVALAYTQYEKKLRESGALDFDDLLMKTVFLLKKFPEIARSYQNQFTHIMVDEYQDTNHAQYILTHMLVSPERNICVVGDASQSIYRWRGADYRNILNFKKDYPDAKEYFLERNYRSTQSILDAAHGVITKNTSHPVLNLWTEKGRGDPITLYEARNESDEAQYIAQTVLQSGRPFSEIAVLYRTNAQSRVIEEAFLHNGIPYILVGGTKFYDRKEIRDAISYLKLLYNHDDSASLKRAEKIGKNRLAKFIDLRQSLERDNLLVSHTTLELLDMVLEKTGYMELYDANVEEEAYRLENIKELRSVAAEFPILSDFLENVSLMEEEYVSERTKDKDANRVAVTLMTLHAAKGLEYPVVFIVGMEEGLFPHSRSLMDREEMEEERRLCYVGITRAKELLYLSYANRRLYFGTRTQNMVSRFISDIPAELLNHQVSLSAARGFREEDLLI